MQFIAFVVSRDLSLRNVVHMRTLYNFFQIYTICFALEFTMPWLLFF